MDAVLLSVAIERRTKIIDALRHGYHPDAQGENGAHGGIDAQGENGAHGGIDARMFGSVWGGEREQLFHCAKVGLNVHQWPARVVELPRLLHYLEIGTATVSEDGIDYLLESELDEAVSFASEGGDFLSAVKTAVQSQQMRRRMRRKGHAICRLRDQRLLLLQTIAALFPDCGGQLLSGIHE
jgi:hypothetical protein